LKYHYDDITNFKKIGVLGFFATGNDQNNLQGNYGILDQRLSIAWVKGNINKFGGNPNEV
jgi:carboxylesterase type B